MPPATPDDGIDDTPVPAVARGAGEADELVEAINADRLGLIADEALHGPSPGATRPDADPGGSTLARACATCVRIGDRMSDESAQAVAALKAAGIRARPGPRGPRQRHATEVRVADAGEAARSVEILATLGFERWETYRGGAEASFWRTSDHVALIRQSDTAVVLSIRWADRRPPSRPARLLTPTAADWRVIQLPRIAWPAFHLVRPVRLAVERAGLRTPRPGAGPPLSTPASLTDPLLDLADVGRDDTVMDIGCGDGRLVVHAAATRGCRAIGVEHDETRAARARHRAAEAGVGDRVRIVQDDLAASPFAEASVLLLFLPDWVLARVLPEALAGMPAGSRIVAHEQAPLPADLAPPPDRREPLVTDDALTVAHLWHVG